jgi:hypothetical protein
MFAIDLLRLRVGPILEVTFFMTKPKFFYCDPHDIRGALSVASQNAKRLHQAELDLIVSLEEVDQDRLFVWLGYRSLKSYCVRALKLTRTQAQRIVTQVRRSEPTSKIGT